MGYCIHMEDGYIAMKREDKKKALAAIKALGDQCWVQGSEIAKCKHLRDAMQEWSWPIEEDEDDNVVGIFFHGEKAGAETELFEAIAPWVEAGSFIHIVGEDGAHSRYMFDGKGCEEQYAKLVWE